MFILPAGRAIPDLSDRLSLCLLRGNLAGANFTESIFFLCAVTNYRANRADLAIDVYESAILRFPDDTSLRQHFANTLQVVAQHGKRQDKWSILQTSQNVRVGKRQFG